MDKEFEGILKSGGSRTSKSPGQSSTSASSGYEQSFEMKALVQLQEKRSVFVSTSMSCNGNARTVNPTMELKDGERLQILSSKAPVDVPKFTKTSKCMIFPRTIENWKAIAFRSGNVLTQYVNVCFFDEITFQRLERTLGKLKLWEVTQGDAKQLEVAEVAIYKSLGIPHPSIPEQRLQAKPIPRVTTINEDVTAIKDVQLGDSNRKLLTSKRPTANISYKRNTEEYRLTLGINLPPFKVKSCEVICCPEFYSVEFACELGPVAFVQFKLSAKPSSASSKEFKNAFATPYTLTISFLKADEPHKDYEKPKNGEFEPINLPISPVKTITVSSYESSNGSATQSSVTSAYSFNPKPISSQSSIFQARHQLNGGSTILKSSIESFGVRKATIPTIPPYEKTPQTARPSSTLNLLPASNSSGKESVVSTRPKTTITYGSSSSSSVSKRSRPTIDLFKDPVNNDDDDEGGLYPVRRVTRSQSKFSVDSPIMVSGGFRTSKEIAAREKVLFRYPTGAVVDLVPIRRSDVDRLGDGIYLNDSLIDFYGKRHLEERIKQAEVKNKVHLFSSFFFSRMDHKLSGQSRRRGNGTFDFNNFSKEAMEHRFEAYSRVRTWSRGVDIFEKRFLIVPINRSMHWSIAIVELTRPKPSEETKVEDVPPQAKVFTLDSLGNLHPPHHVTSVIRMYLNHEWMARKKAKSEGKPWPLPPRVVPAEEAEDERTSKAGSDVDDDDSEIEIVDAPSASKKDGMDDEDRFVVTEADQVYTKDNCEYVKLNVPPQRDAYNCGVYALKNIEEFLTIYDGGSIKEDKDSSKVLNDYFLDLNFSARDAQEFRRCFRKDLEALAEQALAAQKLKEQTTS